MSFDRYTQEGYRMKYVFILGVAVIGLLLVLFIAPAIFGYWFHGVDDDQIAITFYKNQITDVVGPGVWSDWRPWADIKDVSVEGLDFCVNDPEVLIEGAEQRIGVTVCGRVRRPGIGWDYQETWAQFRQLYLRDEAVVGERDSTSFVTNGGVVFAIASQSLKVCVGDRSFEQSVVGTGRDDLRVCVDEEMSALAETYGGLSIDNVTVPNVTISPEAQKRMDEITQARQLAELARKQTDQARADAEKRLAEQEGEIKVEQGRLQEEERQKAITADLRRQAIEAEKSVITAEKANLLAAAEADLDIANAQRLAAEQQALAQLALRKAEAEMYEANPSLVDYLINKAFADAYGEVDKLVVPAGTDVRLLMGGQAVPYLNLDNQGMEP